MPILGLIIILVFMACALLVIAFVGESHTIRLAERVERIRQATVVVKGTQLDAELSKSLYERIIVPAMRGFRDRIMQLAPSQAVNGARIKLDRAGSPPSLPVGTFLAIRASTAVLGLVGAVLLAIIWPAPLLMRATIAGLVLLIGVVGPDYLLEARIKARQNTIRKSLPDVIDLLVVSAEAGTGLDGALAVVTRRKQGPLADEFNRVLTELRLGKARPQAWEDMAERVGLDELKMLVAALRQAEQLGVSIAKTLRTQADALRTARSLRVRQIAASLSIKMLFPLIFCILPALFIAVLGPAMMTLSTSFLKGEGF